MFTHSERSRMLETLSEALNTSEGRDIRDAEDRLVQAEKVMAVAIEIVIRLADDAASIVGTEGIRESRAARLFDDVVQEDLGELIHPVKRGLDHLWGPATLDIDRYGGSLGRVAA